MTPTPSTGMRRWWLGLCAACAMIGVGQPARADAAPSEAAVEAAYLYKFLPYVQWPADALPPGKALNVGLAGSDAVLVEFKAIAASKRVDGHTIQVRPLSEGDPIEELHVLYVGKSAGGPALREWARRLQRRPVLIVTDLPDGLDRGAMLALVPADGRIRFVASAASAERAGLHLSARLLAVADKVVLP